MTDNNKVDSVRQDVDPQGRHDVDPKGRHDADPQETQEWLESLDATLSAHGAERAHFLLEQLVDHARRQGAYLPYSAETAYLNTIPVGQQPHYPGDRAIERRIESAMGQQLVKLPTLGGSVPLYLFQEKLGAPSLGVPTVNHDNNLVGAWRNLECDELADLLDEARDTMYDAIVAHEQDLDAHVGCPHQDRWRDPS